MVESAQNWRRNHPNVGSGRRWPFDGSTVSSCAATMRSAARKTSRRRAVRATDPESRVPDWHGDDRGCSDSPIHEGSPGMPLVDGDQPLQTHVPTKTPSRPPREWCRDSEGCVRLRSNRTKVVRFYALAIGIRDFELARFAAGASRRRRGSAAACGDRDSSPAIRRWTSSGPSTTGKRSRRFGYGRSPRTSRRCRTCRQRTAAH
jgi:hypothetical protein